MIRKESDEFDLSERVKKRLQQKPEIATLYAHSDEEGRSRLDNLLHICEEFRHEFGPKIEVWTIGFSGIKELIQEQVRLYLDSPWMQNPSMTGYLASTLIDTTIAPLAWPKNGFHTLTGRIALVMSLGLAWLVEIIFSKQRRFLADLWRISEELDSGFYDGEALARQLRAWEDKGYFVDSQTYSLLRLPSNRIR